MKKEYIVYKLSECAKQACRIDNELFTKYNVKRGLRNEDGTGVLVGLTKIGNVVGYERTSEGLKPIPGKLFYRGYDLDDIAHALLREKRFGFEEVAYLLLSGELPDSEQLSAFKELINDNMPLDKKTTMNIIDLEGQNIMNILARSVLEMYTFDPNPDDISRDNLMRQSVELISKFPTIIAYAYSIYRHSIHGRSLHIRYPHENLSIAENFLYMIKKEYTPLEARVLDLLLVLQAEHGGGNNSTFTVRVTSSTRTDTYSSIAAGIGSLKGPLHGGANIQVVKMFHHLKEVISDWTNTDEIDTYLIRMLNKEAYDKTGLIYGIGHAVYTISDPRAVLLKELAGELVKEKGCADTDSRYAMEMDGEYLRLDTHTFDKDALIIDNSQVGKVTLCRQDRTPWLSLTFDAPLVGLWSPPGKNAPFVCIEPWYGRCDRVGYTGEFSGKDWINKLEAGEEFNSVYTIEI